MKTMKTKLGTELQIMNLKGKDYMMVHQRLVWFREEHPNWSVETEFVTLSDKLATAKATIKDEIGKLIATAHKQENTENFGDFMEKAETGAVGRALLLCGYGTAFAAIDLDEGERIVDTPIEKTIENAKKVLNEEINKLEVKDYNKPVNANLEKKFNSLINSKLIGKYPEFTGLTYKQAADKNPAQFIKFSTGLLESAMKKPDSDEWKQNNITEQKYYLEYASTITVKKNEETDDIPF